MAGKYDYSWRRANRLYYPSKLPWYVRYDIRFSQCVVFLLEVGQIIARSSGQSPQYIANRSVMIEEWKLRIFKLEHDL